MKRLLYLFRRFFHACALSLKGLCFAVRFSKHNRFIDLFRLRKAMESNYISPFHRWKRKKEKDLVRFSARIFGYRSIGLDLQDSFQMAICREFLLEDLYDLSIMPFEPATILDCGAYQGYFTLRAVHFFPKARIRCYEPHPGNAAVLSELFSDEIASGQVVLINSAVTANTNSMQMEIWGSNTRQSEISSTVSHQIAVLTVSFKEVLSSLNPDEPLLLKMDIEGSERELFPDCVPLLPAKCAVFLETHHGDTYLKQVQEVFQDHGFRFGILKRMSEFADVYAVRC